MKRMIDSEKFLDKLLYMGYMDEEKSEVEEVANRMTEEAYTKSDMVAMLEEIKEEMNPIKDCEYLINKKEEWQFAGKCQDVIQQKINALKENKDGSN